MLLLLANVSSILFFCYIFSRSSIFNLNTFCTNFVFLHSKNFKFSHCLGLIDMLSVSQNAEIFLCILLHLKFGTQIKE